MGRVSVSYGDFRMRGIGKMLVCVDTLAEFIWLVSMTLGDYAVVRSAISLLLSYRSNVGK